MRHPGLATLQALAESELAEPHRERAWAHVQQCAGCAATLGWLEEVRSAATSATTRPAPPHAWERIRARVERGETVLLPLGSPPQPHRSLGKVAGAVLLLGAAAGAAAIPGSPVRRWLAERPQPAPAATVASADSALTPVELEVAASDGAVRVRLEGVAGAVRLRVRLSEGDVLAVTATGAAAGARFVSSPGRLVIADLHGGEILLALPGGVQLVLIEHEGAALIEKRGGVLQVLAPAADTVGSEFLLVLR